MGETVSPPTAWSNALDAEAIRTADLENLLRIAEMTAHVCLVDPSQAPHFIKLVDGIEDRLSKVPSAGGVVSRFKQPPEQVRTSTATAERSRRVNVIGSLVLPDGSSQPFLSVKGEAPQKPVFKAACLPNGPAVVAIAGTDA